MDSRKRLRIDSINPIESVRGTDSAATTIYTTYPLESTLLLNTGGIASGNSCIGKLESIPMNADISLGSKLFQYNRYFWNKDIFTFNYSNCCAMIAIAFHQILEGQGITYFLFYPIFLPRTALATYQAVTSGVQLTKDPVKRKALMDDLLYYLNGSFTSFNYDTLRPWPLATWVDYPPAWKLQGGPSLYGANYKGFLQRPTANNPYFPIFQDNGGLEPPLKWIYTSSNNQLGLARNPGYWDQPGIPDGADIAFQIVSPEEFMFRGLNNPTNIITSSVNIPVFGVGFKPKATYNLAVKSTFDNIDDTNSESQYEKGWCSQGCYATGFGQSRGKSASSSHIIFSDIYETSEARKTLFEQTCFPPYDAPLAHDSTQFISWASSFQLVRDVVVARKICSLIPTRFYTVASDILTRDQRIRPLSNNPTLSSPSNMCIEYMDLDFIRTKVDSTALNDTVVSHLNPYYSLQSVDLYMKDEFGEFLQNFRGPSGYHLTFSGDLPNVTPPYPSSFLDNYKLYSGDYLLDAIEGGDCFDFLNVTGIYVIPGWLAAQNPNTTDGNIQPLIGPFSSYLVQCLYGLFHCNGMPSLAGPPVPSTIPANFTGSMPISGNLIHFGRVLGN